MDDATPPQRKRGIFLLPNLFTTAGLLAGFFSIISSINHNFSVAGIAIFIAVVMDVFDGRIARMTNTQSKFGAEYDSLADMTSFGLAPALLSYQWALHDFSKYGWIVAFVYVAGAALRLARFNTQVGSVDKKYFQGLASPAAAAVIAGMVWVCADNQLEGESLRWLMLTLTIFTGVMMVSNVRYTSFKDVNFRDKVPFVSVIIIALVFIVIAFDPAIVLFVFFFGYALSGLVTTLYLIHRKRQEKRSKHQPPP
jgi:CDP-diacylglycerol---serine O-phosphatidyltransferase